MIKVDKHIEIVRSSVPRLSSMSQESCDAIFAVLAKHYYKVGVTTVNNLADLEALVARKPDLVFLGMKSVPEDMVPRLQNSDKIWVSEFLDRHNIAYTGSDQLAHELEYNKPLAKQCMLDAGLKTSPFFVIRQGQLMANVKVHLPFPLFIKPTSHGGGMGIDSSSLAHDSDELYSKVQYIATELQSDSLIEEYLPGREFSVSILKDELSNELLVMPIELIAQPDNRGARILSGQVKSSNSEQALLVDSKVIESQVNALAIDVFHALGARDYGRIDIRLDEAGTPHFLEANLLPSLISGYGSFPKACALNINLGYETMILIIARLGLRRNLNGGEDILEPTPSVPAFLPAIETALEPV